MARFTESGGLAAKIIAGRRDKARTREGWIHLVLNVAILTAVLLVVFSFVLCVFRVSGNEMYPKMQDGDLVLAWRLAGGYTKDDVVVYTVDGEQQVGRVVAKEGDIIDISDDGTVSVDGTTESDTLYVTEKGDAVEYPYAVPKGYVFILGDYRTQAEDSRDFGAVSVQDVQGTVIGLLRRRNL